MSENFEGVATILPSHYKLDGDKLEITLVDGMSATAENFEELAKILPSYCKLDLINSKFAIMPVNSRIGQKEAKLIYEAYPPIAPNFVAEIRSNRDTAEAVHEKMCLYMDAGVE
ncbi:19591_t:CDS:2, partial [Racocetra fulgida]